jgi:anti-sigma regulatory factor (Ser/Thr protein kinase)
MDERTEKPHELSLDLPAAHSAERMARTVLRQFARRESVAKSEIETLEFVASELLSNAVDHGGGERAMEESDLPRRVRMKLFVTVDAGGWRMQVSDEGGGDPKEVELLIAQNEMPDLEDERGRGFFLLTQMVDSLRVDRSADGRGLVFTAVRTYARST